MVQFKPTCRQCFIEKGQSIPLVEQDGKMVCPENAAHETRQDVEVA
ncbi:hypothetical protein HYS54_02965 [Candidatus Micrarchaeota archaeon]|nr:hypothetical protein [Candidatus Micrarchaeota archaeon]